MTGKQLSWRLLWHENPLRSALGKRILAWLLLLSLVPLFVSNSVGYLASSRIIERLAARDLEAFTVIQAHHVRDEIERLLLSLSSAVRNDRLLVASAAAFRDPAADPAVLSGASSLAAEELTRLQRQLHDFTAVELVDSSGVVVAASSRFTSGTRWVNRAALRQAAAEGQTFDVERGGAPPLPRLVFLVSLSGPASQPPLLVVGTIEWMAIGSALQLSTLFPGGIEGFVVDAEGLPVFVAHPRGAVDYARPLPSFRSMARGSGRYLNGDGREVVGSVHPVPGYRLHFVSEVPVRAALGELRGLRFVSVLLGSAFLLVVIAAAWSVSRSIVRPVYALVGGTERIARGDLGTSVDVPQRDELGLLGQRFNDMATQLRESAARIRDYHNEEMRRAEQLATVGELAAGIAHELKSPLLAIGSGVQLLSRRLDASDAEGRRLAEETLQRIARMEGAVQELLSYARPTPAHMARLDFNAVVERALRLVEPRAERSGVQIRRELSTGLPPVFVDPDQISQVVVNLALNGIEAMQSGGHLAVATRSNEGAVEMSVSDTGPGVAAEERERIFRPFHTTKHAGTGLGLAIVRQVLDRHGGTIALSDAAGGGAQFVVTLPLEVDEPERRG
jgi:signal transduction histidine kinase